MARRWVNADITVAVMGGRQAGISSPFPAPSNRSQRVTLVPSHRADAGVRVSWWPAHSRARSGQRRPVTYTSVEAVGAVIRRQGVGWVRWIPAIGNSEKVASWLFCCPLVTFRSSTLEHLGSFSYRLTASSCRSSSIWMSFFSRSAICWAWNLAWKKNKSEQGWEHYPRAELSRKSLGTASTVNIKKRKPSNSNTARGKFMYSPGGRRSRNSVTSIYWWWDRNDNAKKSQKCPFTVPQKMLVYFRKLYENLCWLWTKSIHVLSNLLIYALQVDNILLSLSNSSLW